MHNLISKLRLAVTHWRRQILFALFWAVSVAFVVCLDFIRHEWPIDMALATVFAFYFAGAFVGGYFTLLLATASLAGLVATARFSGFFTLLTIFTLGFTVVAFIVEHRIYFSQWHGTFGSSLWLHQTFFTALGSIVLFALSGLRPLLPWGVVLLFIASICFSRGWLTPPVEGQSNG